MNIQAITPEFIIETIGKYRWLLILPVLFCLTVGFVLCFALPNIYEANTMILVEPQRVPTNYVQTIVSQDIGARISTISEQILSRTNLEKIIQEFGLFTEERFKDLYLEDKIDGLRKRIKVNLTRSREGADAFSISFKGSNPDQVMKIANTLANYFIDENLKVREDYAIGTTRFLEQELNEKRNKLEQTENRLIKYRSEHMGELPEQLKSNMQMLESLQKRLDNKIIELRVLKSSMYDLSQNSDAMAKSGLSDIFQIDSGISISDTDASSEPLELSQMREELKSLKLRYTEKHPDVVRLSTLIEKMEKQLEEKRSANEEKTEKSKSDKGGVDTDKSILNLDFNAVRKADLNKDIGTTQKEIDKLQAEIEDYRKRVANTPFREQELIEIQRDYNNIKDSYNSLLSRKLEADIAVSMEKKQKGERFRILDYAKKPERPISPDLVIILVGSLLAGLAIGVGGVIVIEFMKNTYFTPGELEEDLNIEVLGYVHPIFLPKEAFHKKINFFASVSAACLCVVLFLGMIVVTVKGKGQIIQYIESMFS